MRKLFFVLVGSALLAQTGGFIDYAADGSMNLPKDYRQWVFLSSGINMSYTPNGGNAANPTFDNVLVNPAAYAGFLKTGTWPDKTAMILEVRGSDSKVSINKEGRVQTGVVAIEAHVKDASRGGWAFYGFHDSANRGTLFPKTADCYSCHEKSGAVDTTFVQFYPTLIDPAKQHNTYHATE